MLSLHKPNQEEEILNTSATRHAMSLQPTYVSGTRAVLRRSLLLLPLAFASISVLAQNPLTEIAGSTYREKTVYAVYDLPGKDLKVEAIESAALDAVRTYARNSQVRQGIPMTPFPEYPGQMTIGTRNSGGPKPDCAGEVFSIEGLDKSMAKYGEMTYHRFCLFPYAGGYRLNYFALYGQQSGVGNPNPNVLSAMLGRAMGSLVGLGDSSVIINKMLERLEGNLHDAGMTYKLVQLHPKDMTGRVLVEDDLVRPTAPAVTALPPSAVPVAVQPQPTPNTTPLPAQTAAALPPELAQLQFAMQRQNEMLRQQMAAKQAAASPTKKPSAVEARKELTAMGLQYFSQEQFVAAIRRGDSLAVDLFITGGGVDLNLATAGVTPLKTAESSGQQEIVALLKNNGAH